MMSILVFFIFLFVIVANGWMLPKWNVTYQMNRSTIVMPCNYSGYMNNDAVKELARYGVVDFDWSNAKLLWANTSPMNCQARLLTQAQAIKAINPSTKVFVYRNLAKALPWFADVREKLMDPAYNNWWFLKFKSQGPYNQQPCTNTSVDKCSMFYHDQLQTPEHPAQCHQECDCGGGANNAAGLPCGEYLWDHRNASLRKWLTDVHIMGPAANGSGLNNPAIDGFYIDDGWSDTQGQIAPWMPKTGFCNTYNTFGGVSEEDYKCVQDMGLTAADVEDIYQGWRQSMQSAQSSIVATNGFNWQLFHGVGGSPNKTECSNWLRSNVGKSYNDSALMYTYTVFPNSSQQQLNVDLAMFLLIRGDYAWLGYGWNGCHDKWEYQWNDMLDKDYGEPVGDMVEFTSGVFGRKFSKCTVQMDCNTYQASFNFIQT